MRIGLIYDAVFPYVIGGAEHRNYELARLLGAGDEVALYGFAYWGAEAPPALSGCRYVGVAPPVPLYDAAGKRRIAEALYFAWRLGPALWRGGEDVWDIANFPYFSVPVARLVAWLRGKRLVVTWLEHWGGYWREYLGWRGVVGQLIERVALWCSPRVIVLSEHTRRQLVQAGYPRRRITVVPGGIDWAAMQAVPAAPGGSDLVYAGRLVPHKRVDLILRALALLPECHLEVIGEGPSRGELERLAGELGVSSRVRFVGRLATAEEVFARFKSSGALVQASEREGFGMTVLQALACGAPAVVCRQRDSAAAELIDAAFKGRVVEPKPGAIAAACREVLAAGAAGRAERVAAARAYDWPAIAARARAVYEGAR